MLDAAATILFSTRAATAVHFGEFRQQYTSGCKWISRINSKQFSVEEVEWLIARFAVLAGSCWLHVQSALVQQAWVHRLHPAPPPLWGPTRRASNLHGLLLLRRPWPGEARGHSATRRSTRVRSAAAHTTSTSMSAARSIYVDHPDGQNDGCTPISAGPIFRAPMENFTLFAHGLVGGARAGRPEQRRSRYALPRALQLGRRPDGRRRYGLRPAVLQPPLLACACSRLTTATSTRTSARTSAIPTGGVLGGRANLSGVELSTGIVTHFGHIIPPPPVTYACAVSLRRRSIPGDPVTVTGTATEPEPEEDGDLHLDVGWRHGLRHVERCQHRHQDARGRHLHGQGPRRPKARSLARWRTARRRSR